MKPLDLTRNGILKEERDGTIRVNGSRITLDTLIALFKRGETLDQIQDGFPSLARFQISGVINWYLRNKAWAEDYLGRRRRQADALRRKIESDPQNAALRELLRARRDQLSKP